jgi:hypothetical protein
MSHYKFFLLNTPHNELLTGDHLYCSKTFPVSYNIRNCIEVEQIQQERRCARICKSFRHLLLNPFKLAFYNFNNIITRVLRYFLSFIFIYHHGYFYQAMIIHNHSFESTVFLNSIYFTICPFFLHDINNGACSFDILKSVIKLPAGATHPNTNRNRRCLASLIEWW